MSMKGVYQSFDEAGNSTNALPSRQAITIAAAISPYISPELAAILNTYSTCWNTFPCVCEVDPSLSAATKQALILVLMADFHGRDPQLLLQNAQQFCTTLIDWADQGRNRDPNGYRVGMAVLLSQDPPHMTYPYTNSDVACLSAMAMFLLDAIVAGQPTEFESAARSLNIQPRLTRPPNSTSASPFAVPPPAARHIYNRGSARSACQRYTQLQRVPVRLASRRGQVDPIVAFTLATARPLAST